MEWELLWVKVKSIKKMLKSMDCGSIWSQRIFSDRGSQREKLKWWYESETIETKVIKEVGIGNYMV